MDLKLKQHIEQSLFTTLGASLRVNTVSSIGGGCINNACKLQTTAGNFFLKYNDARLYPGMFEAEAKGLALLRSAEANIPQVILTGESGGTSYIVLEFVEAGKRKPDFWDDFGKRLAKLHQHSNSYFGLDHDNYIGSLPQCNTSHSSWIDFFIHERLEKQVALAGKSGAIDLPTMKQFDNLYKQLPEIIPVEKPSLLHGDLWNGNYMQGADGGACLIDPAVYYGHREMDLAMTHLFGGFDNAFYNTYEDVFPLAPGFESRIGIHNLYPLMVHVNLFGGGYISQVKAILSRFR